MKIFNLFFAVSLHFMGFSGLPARPIWEILAFKTKKSAESFKIGVGLTMVLMETKLGEKTPASGEEYVVSFKIGVGLT